MSWKYEHPVNQVHHDLATRGERLADGIAATIGSWHFLIVQTCIVVVWMSFNALAITGRLHFDPVPYILLNLAFSTQAAYTGPVLLLAGNRQSQKDRLTLEHDYDNTVAILGELRRNTSATLKIVQHLGCEGDQGEHAP